MNTKRNIGTIAALGGLTAMVALLTGMPSAKADELSDLRANNQLLQQRLDQLAQAPGPANPYGLGGPPGPVNVNVAGGSFPRSFLIPGTDTSIRVGGEIREVVDYFFSGGNPNGSPFSTTVGVNGQAQSAPLDLHNTVGAGGVIVPTSNVAKSRGNSIFGQSPRESKLSVETRTPTAFGEARTYMEFDWAGSTAFAPGGGNVTSVSDNLVPRLRFAYGTLGGFLAGQANSNFSDPDASAEVIDFGGTFGDPGVVRVPQVRYTTPLEPYGLLGALSFSAETPETDIAAPFIAGTTTIGNDAGVTGGAISATGVVTTITTNPTKTPAPDLTVAWYIPQPWGHFDISGVVRPTLQIKDGLFVDRTFVGYGGHIGFDVKPGWFGWDKDDITFQAVGGDALGRYLNSSTNFSLITNYPGAAPTTAAAAASVLIKPTREYGGNIGYKHYWTPTLRSNISAGINFHDFSRLEASGTPICSSFTAAAFTGGGGCGLNKQIWNGHVNLIWNPVSFADVGIEYTYAHRVVESGQKGDLNALIGRFRVIF